MTQPRDIAAYTEAHSPAPDELVGFVNFSRVDGDQIRLTVRQRDGVQAELAIPARAFYALVRDSFTTMARPD